MKFLKTARRFSPGARVERALRPARPFSALMPDVSNTPLPSERSEEVDLRQQRSEAFELELREKHGTMTPEEGERLTSLREQLKESWDRKMEVASAFGHNFARIAGTIPDRAVSERAAPPPASSPGGLQPIQMQRHGSGFKGKYRESAKLNQRIKQQQQQRQGRWEAEEPKRKKAKAKRERRQQRRMEQRRQERQRKQAMKKEYLGLSDENAWKEVIDADFHEYGAQTFDKGLHDADPEPGYLESVLKAREFVAENLGEQMDASFLENVHRLAASHKQEGNEGYRRGFRDKQDKQVSISYTEGTDYVKGKPKQALEELDPNVTKAYADKGGVVDTDEEEFNPEKMGFVPTEGEDDNLMLHFLPKSKKQVKRETNKIFGNYYHKLKKIEPNEQARRKKLELISHTHRRLENLHPFLDANTRTNRLILHKMLVENEMSPVILSNPLQVHLNSDEEWADVLEEGMKSWKEAREEQEEL